MANTLAPFGFAEAYVLGGPPTYQQSRRRIASGYGTAIFKGDPVVQISSGYIQQAAAGTTQIAGIFLGCEYTSTAQKRQVWSPYWPGSDATGDVIAYVSDGPLTVFRAQANAQLLFTAVGNNINFSLATAGSTNTGLSGATLDVSTVLTTSTLPFRVVELIYDPPGANGADTTTAYNWAYVTFNWQDYKSTTGI
jgi:hypothetical protein